jgi:hypothetical protein
MTRPLRSALVAAVLLAASLGVPAVVAAHDTGEPHEEPSAVADLAVVGGLGAAAFAVGVGGTWWLRSRRQPDEEEE